MVNHQGSFYQAGYHLKRCALSWQAFLAWTERLAAFQTEHARRVLAEAAQTLLSALDAGPLETVKEGFTQKLTKFQLMVSRCCVPISD